MSIFVIFRVPRPEKMEAALARVYPADHLKLEEGQYLVAANGSAKEISDKLDISDGDTGSAIVFKMTNYFGRAPTDIWDWIKSKAEKSDG